MRFNRETHTSEFCIDIVSSFPYDAWEMGSSKEAPEQHKQPSRKGKKAWRKNVDVTDLQAGLEEARDQEIKGLVSHLYSYLQPDWV